MERSGHVTSPVPLPRAQLPRACLCVRVCGQLTRALLYCLLLRTAGPKEHGTPIHVAGAWQGVVG